MRDPETGAFDWARLVHEQDLAQTQDSWREATATQREFACAHRLLMADGSYRWHLSRATPVYGAKAGEVEWFGTATDIDALKRAEDHRLLLLQELEHRIKNILSLVNSIASQTFRGAGGNPDALKTFNDRIRALAGANDLLVRANWTETPVDEVVSRTLEPLGVGHRVARSGDPMTVPAGTAFVLALGLYELATNALKHGSLTLPDGTVSLNWELDPARPGGFRVVWEEQGGPPVRPPEREGFGSRLLRSALATEIGGRVELEFRRAASDARSKAAELF